ncbi:hypothetical protein DACRYDRAFT_112476 [Dacryopinax primogenitus]|uniref:Integrase core domain-containing protein n=1 Tax=Dacryopinax primogenitus (strain DJM 731) TaxID=1858805 RepID=M5FQ14_DACPD|nr:uncharacterized protein DACRYDRAFT_112476 [Dacryopinax primogenitus]EJT96669.1 hypothetical protein DACRYDRAFT_112476 [Dacryopinax primogenitus]
MWVDVKKAFVRKWAAFFNGLEDRHGLNPLNKDHLWLLQWLFLPDINDDATQFQNQWNFHTLSLAEGNRRPVDLFISGCIESGARGIDMDMGEDPQYTCDPQRYRAEGEIPAAGSVEGIIPNPGFNSSTEPPSRGDELPHRLNTVDLPVPRCRLTPRQLLELKRSIELYSSRSDDIALTERWRVSLRACTSFNLMD